MELVIERHVSLPKQTEATGLFPVVSSKDQLPLGKSCFLIFFSFLCFIIAVISFRGHFLIFLSITSTETIIESIETPLKPGENNIEFR